ncbi:flagellar biosynthetic protein FliO [Jeotgalibacillus sp. S-D1]|uniref:flagellar biosynthetic protein FliO n=1 Tax=Jeotgalibacillus sp. S-D1 TaxID=2552189 RepID=UPI0014051B5F|nr:flagellar biosynthetic protein FliO [Jeotgalibacillus sp. S-D1]
MKIKIVVIVVPLILLSTFLAGEESSLANKSMVNQCFENESNCSDDSIQPAHKSGSEGGITWVDYIKLIAALCFVVFLLYVLLKFVNSRSRNFQQTKIIHNLGGTALGSNRSIQIVKIAGTFYVLGVGENINLIKEVTTPEEINRFKHFYQNDEERDSGSLNGFFRKGKKEVESFQSLLAAQLIGNEKRNQIKRKDKNKEQRSDG